MASNDRQKGAPILIIEDDAVTLHTMRDYLSRAGFTVRTAANGWDALKRLKESPVDLIISELNISDMDGSSLREKCVMNPQTRDIPFLFLVDEDQKDSQVRALRSGVDDCVTKPFDPIILVARVQAVIERRLSYEEMVRIDPLTRLLNRPTLERVLREELARVRRYDRIATIVILDIDDFEEANAEGGTAMGDLLLTCLGGVVLTTIRTMDIASRYHGEKFLIYLPETLPPGALILTKRIQEQLTAIADKIAGFNLTFSAGIVLAPNDGLELDDLLENPELALTKAKSDGKGTIVTWSPDIVVDDA